MLLSFFMDCKHEKRTIECIQMYLYHFASWDDIYGISVLYQQWANSHFKNDYQIPDPYW